MIEKGRIVEALKKKGSTLKKQRKAPEIPLAPLEPVASPCGVIRPPKGRKIVFEDAEPAETVEEKDLEKVVVEFSILLTETENVKEKMDTKLFFILD